ncbi:MAG: hypothetical protein JWQ96_2239 [Segetibacter sp.]|nr:hypothetical protein [Segetibacter sp.]
MLKLKLSDCFVLPGNGRVDFVQVSRTTMLNLNTSAGKQSFLYKGTDPNEHQ